MPTALFISPHLDDVAFSCTRLLGFLAITGWRCIVGTVFTKSIPNPSGFALECQTTKGLAATIDYMEVRRAEDRLFVDSLNQGLSPRHPIEACHGNFPEAPHRGYDSAEMLFAGIRDCDQILSLTKQLIDSWVNNWKPDKVILPCGYGYHVDHLQVLKATAHLGLNEELIRYRDTPYIIRYPGAESPLSLEGTVRIECMGETAQWFKSVGLAAIACYQTQLPFQYGGEILMREIMARQFEWYWVPRSR